MSKAQLRGDYSRAAPDYSVEQDWGRYSAEEHALYRRLFERQARLVPKYACPEWIAAIAGLDSSREIPKFHEISQKLKSRTGWEIVAVPGLIPDDAFFTHLANRRFPVTVWLRKPEEFDYIVEPDVFHDFFGHVPLLFDRVYADHLHEYGKGGLKAMRLDAVNMLARLYWYTIEFGLVKTKSGIRAYGAGLLTKTGWGEPLTGLLFAAVICAAVGYITSFMIVRLQHLALIMITTLAFLLVRRYGL